MDELQAYIAKIEGRGNHNYDSQLNNDYVRAPKPIRVGINTPGGILKQIEGIAEIEGFTPEQFMMWAVEEGLKNFNKNKLQYLNQIKSIGA